MSTPRHSYRPPLMARLQGQQLELRRLCAGAPEISEVMTANRDTLVDDFGESSDWIEIVNRGDESLDLQGWFLTDDNDRLNRWPFPAKVLSVDEHLIVFASGRDRRDPAFPLHTNFRLSRDGEFVALVHPDGRSVAHALQVPVTPSVDLSYGLVSGTAESTLEVRFLAIPTPGAPNRRSPMDPGALIDSVTHTPAIPQPLDGLVVKAKVVGSPGTELEFAL